MTKAIEITGIIVFVAAVIVLVIRGLSSAGHRNRLQSTDEVFGWMGENFHLRPAGEFTIPEIMEGTELSYAVVFHVLKDMEESGKVVSRWSSPVKGDRHRLYRLRLSKIGDDDETRSV